MTRDEVVGHHYTVLEGPETDVATVQELWLAVHENREITVELVRINSSTGKYPLLLLLQSLASSSVTCDTYDAGD